jgi:hypothetical protein
MSWLEIGDLLNFRLTCSQNNEMYNSYFVSSAIEKAKFDDIITIKKVQNYYRIDETCMELKRYRGGQTENLTPAKWKNIRDKLRIETVKIKVVITKGEITTICLLIAPENIRAQTVKIMVASYYMTAPSRYEVYDDEYFPPNKHGTMFIYEQDGFKI